MAALLLAFLALVPFILPGQTVARPRLSRPPTVVQPQPERIPVPELVGRDVKEAVQLLDRRRLRLGQLTRRSSGERAGTVIGQEPAAGTMVEPDTPVHLVIAVQRRPSRAVVPPLIDHSLPEAREILADARLTMGEVQELPSERPAGRVVRQSPNPGVEVDPGSPVNLWLSAQQVVVPSVVGRTREEAEGILAESRLQCGGVRSRPSDREPGTVLNQRPAAGTMVEPDTPVDLVVAVQRRPSRAVVPPLIDYSLPEAREILADSRLTMGEVRELPSERPRGIVIRQQPGAGTEVEPASPVNLWLAAPAETPVFVVPPVLGHTREEAEKILAEAGLRPGSVTSQDSARPPGTVIEQRPAPGARLAQAVPVDLVLAAGIVPTLIPVPDLTGLTREQAEAILAGSRLLMGRVDGRTSDSQSGLVLEQKPPAGTQVPPGTPVNLVVSKSSLLPAIAGGALALLALLGGSYFVMKKKAGLPSSMELRPHRDAGSPSVEPGAGHLVEPEIRVRPVADRGEQRLEGEVIPK